MNEMAGNDYDKERLFRFICNDGCVERASS
jgi:hypothetical protein